MEIHNNSCNDQNYNLWTDKYKPHSTSEIIGNSISIKKLKDWSNSFKNKKTPSSVIVTGNHGVGKSISVELVLKEAGYDPQILYPNDIKNHKLMEELIQFTNYNNSIYNNMCKKINKQYVLIIDEAESITLTSEKNYIMTLNKINNKNKFFPIVFICNTQHSKMITEIKKTSLEVKFYQPNDYEIKNFVKSIFKKEDITVKKDRVYDKIIDFSQSDIRRLLTVLQELHYVYKGKVISSTDIRSFIETSKKKNTDIGLFDGTSLILDDFTNIDDILILYETEKVLLPLMIHENYYKKIFNNFDSVEDIICKNKEISDSISFGDNIETSIYTDQNWYLQNIHGFYTCVNTSYNINTGKSSGSNKAVPINFSSDLNKTSLKNINRKNIHNLLKIIPDKTIDEILVVNIIINNLLEKEKYEEVIKIIKEYKPDVTIKDIELFSKIDKTSGMKADFKAKQKKQVQKLIKSICTK
jgi:DNA polymerase III delta prime subunit